jgi:cytochrome c oxidase subunit IV
MTTQEHRVSGAALVTALLVLLGLTALSFGLAFVELGAFGPALALIVAGIKAGIVFVVFMHLLDEPFSMRIVAVLLVRYIALLCLGVAADVSAR